MSNLPRWMPATVAAAVIAALLGGCVSFHVGPDARQESARLLALDLKFSHLSEQTGPREAFAKYLAPDALQLAPHQPPVQGRAAILANMKSDRDHVLVWKPRRAEAAVSGDLGWTWGTWQYRDRVSGKVLERGKYVSVWKRQLDGSWKVIVDSGSRSPMPGGSQ